MPKSSLAENCLRPNAGSPFHPDTNTCTIELVQLAGIRVPDVDLFELAGLGDEPVASRLRDALERKVVVLGLTVHEREQILRGLDDPQTGALAELRGVLLAEHVQRVNSGLI